MAKIKSFDELDKALLRIGELDVSLSKKEASMNAHIQKVRDEFDQETKESRDEKFALETDIEVFCQSNKRAFDHERTKIFTHGEVGFSKNPPKVVQLNKKWTVKSSLEFIKKLFEGKYLRSKEEVNKDEILADYAAEKLDDSKLAAVGLRIEQEERFRIEINWESLNEKKAS